MKKYIISTMAAAAIVLTGCGGGGGSSTTSSTVTSETKTLTDLDGFVVGAKVCDDKGDCYVSGANGVVSGTFDPNSVITSVGGKIDVNMNGVADSYEPNAPTMQTVPGATVITPLTTLVANNADINKLAEMLNTTPDAILNENPFETGDQNLLKAYQIAYTALNENKVSALVTQINSYIPQSTTESTTYLPVSGSSTSSSGLDKFGEITSSVLSEPEAKNYILYVLSTTASDIKTLDYDLETQKASVFENMTFSTTSETNTTSSSTSSESESTTTASTGTTTTATTTSSYTQPTSSSSYLPVGESTVTTTTSPSVEDVDIPNNSGTFTSVTSATYIPYSNEPVHILPEYVITVNGVSTAVTKDSDYKFEFSSYKYINVNNNEEFNITNESDINTTSLFKDYDVSPDGNFYGEITLHYYDENNLSREVNLTFKNVVFKVLDNKLDSIKFVKDFTSVDLNSSEVNLSRTLADDFTFNNYEMNITDVLLNDGNLSSVEGNLSDINTNDFSTVGHSYIIDTKWDINSYDFELVGKYKIINTTPPSLEVDNYQPLVFAKDSDVNFTIGTTNKSPDEAQCEFAPSGTGLSCAIYSVNGQNVVNIVGKTPDTDSIINADITIKDDYNNTVTQSAQIDVMEPAKTVIVQNYDLDADADGNYTGEKIFMEINGTVSTNDIVDVNTSLSTLTSGAPENNVTVFLFKDKDTMFGSGNDYIKFVFDRNVYGDNDVFVIKNDDGKVVKFRVGDVTPSNNSFYFTNPY